MTGPPTLHLVDASPYVFRAYFSLPPSLVDPAGAPVNAVYGFTGFLLDLIEAERPTHLGVAFDGSLTTSFRNDFFPAYKAQRDLPPPELEAQLDACQEMARALGAATFIDPRYEADDLIATLCARLLPQSRDALVVTSDKDLAQLVSERVTLWDYARSTRYRPADVVEKLGVRPEQIADLLGLAGDAVDNIPGVKGIGRKTAAALLAVFPDLDELYRRLGEVAALPLRGAAGIARRLAEARDIAFLSRRLATVARDAPVEAELGDLALAPPDPALLDPLFARLGFSTLAERARRLA